MIALIAATIMLVAGIAPLIAIYMIGVAVGRRGGTRQVAVELFTRGRELNEARRKLTGGKHRGQAVTMGQLLGK